MQAMQTDLKLLASGIAMGESPRWHQDRLWLADWGAQEILAVSLTGNDLAGKVERMVQVPFALPFCFDWLADGRLVIVAGREGRLVRQEADGSLVTHADLTPLSSNAWNEIVVDGRGNAYINTGDAIALVRPDGSVAKVADGGAFPNGMAVTPDNATLILAESHGRCLTAFDIAADGSLSGRRTWAQVDGPPDGITIDADGAVWYADVPNKRCVRVLEGGKVTQTVTADRGCFACMLGGAAMQTLFVVATEWRGMDKVAEVAAARTGQLLAIEAPAAAAGWPGPILTSPINH